MLKYLTVESPVESLVDFEDPEYSLIQIQRSVNPRKGIYLECDSRFGQVFALNRFRSSLESVYLDKPQYRCLYARIIRLQSDGDILMVETYLPYA